MRILISYIDFHWDNHQGGSGKSFNMRYSLTLPNDLKVCNFREYILEKLNEHIEKQRPFRQIEKASILRIEIL